MKFEFFQTGLKHIDVALFDYCMFYYACHIFASFNLLEFGGNYHFHFKCFSFSLILSYECYFFSYSSNI
jgi:hypothetical protein